jgi:glutamate-ammonia-ligase adenylyltransferase
MLPVHRQLLMGHGFADPDLAYRNLLSLADNPSTPHLKAKTQRLFKALLSRLLLYLRNCPDPDMALNSLEQIINRLGARTTLYSIMADSPQLVEMLVTLTGGSRYLSEILFRDPSLVETLGRENTLQRRLNRETLGVRLDLIRSAHRGQEGAHESLIRLRNALTLETGLRYLLGISDVQTLGADLAAAADFILQQVVLRTAEEMRERYPRFFETASGNFGVVALGKLGGQELSFASDLDVIFLHEECEPSREVLPSEFFSRWAARICAFLSETTPFGRLYECDPRLRPYGKSGALCTSLATFDQYVRNHARVWERMALTRCRPVVGSEDWQRRFNRVWHRALFSQPFGRSDREEVVEMRLRIEREKGDAALKAGPGGLVDVEFIAQTLVLQHGREYGTLCEQSTPDVLATAADLRLLPTQSSLQLRRSYLFLRDIENRLQIVNHLSIDSLPKDETDLDRLAKRCFPQQPHRDLSGRELVQEVESHTSRIREIFREFFQA